MTILTEPVASCPTSILAPGFSVHSQRPQRIPRATWPRLSETVHASWQRSQSWRYKKGPWGTFLPFRFRLLLSLCLLAFPAPPDIGRRRSSSSSLFLRRSSFLSRSSFPSPAPAPTDPMAAERGGWAGSMLTEGHITKYRRAGFIPPVSFV